MTGARCNATRLDLLSRATISLVGVLPRPSSSLPAPGVLLAEHRCPNRASNRPQVVDPQTLRDLARGGVCRAPFVTEGAVGSYSTVSPLPDPHFRAGHRRFAFCCTVPHPRPNGVGPCGCGPGRKRVGGRYPPPCPSVLGLSSRPSVARRARGRLNASLRANRTRTDSSDLRPSWSGASSSCRGGWRSCCRGGGWRW